MTRPLTSEAARGWTTRVPHDVIGVGLPLTVVLMIAFASSDDAYIRTVEEAVSWRHLATYAVSMLGAGAALLAWAVPRVCLGVFLTCCMIAAVVGGDPNEVTAGLVWAPIAALDVFLALRQKAMATDWPREQAMITDRAAVRRTTGLWRWESLGLALIAMAGAIVALLWWVNGRADLIAFDERAVTEIVLITKTDDSLDTVYADVAGKEREFWVDDASRYQVGSELAVRIDPERKYAPMGPDDADPRSVTDIGALFAPLAFLALLLLLTPRHRARQTMLASVDRRPVRAFVRPSLTNDAVVEIMTAEGRVIAIACDVTYTGDLDEQDWEEDDGLLILGEGSSSYQVDLSGLPPGTDLDEWLGQSEPDDTDLPRDDTPQPALIFGLERYGQPVVIQLIGDAGSSLEMLVPARPLRDPHTLKSLLGHLTALNGRDRDRRTTRPQVDSPDIASDSSYETPMVHQLLVARRTFGPLVGLLGLWFAVWWLNEPNDPSVWQVVGGALQGGFAGFGFAMWFSLERPLARLGRLGVMLPGASLDRLLPDHRLVSVTTGTQSATITLRDPDERVGVIVDPSSPHLATDLAELRTVVDAAIARRRPEPSGWSLPQSLPSPGSVFVAFSALVGASAIVFG